MSDDEIKLVATLARDPTWSSESLEDPYLTRSYFEHYNSQAEVPDTRLRWEDAADAADLWLTIDEATGFLRYFCFWQDSTPKATELRYWLGELAQKHVKLCDLTQESWSRIIQTEAIKRLNP